MPHVFRLPETRLAYEFSPGAGPVVVFCAGFASDMGGTKALALAAFCHNAKQAFLRFDYSGHGQSGGTLAEGCIGDWTADAEAVITQVVGAQDILLIGSSMGGWICLLLARRFKARVRAILLIAPAPDFTERLIKPALSAPQLKRLETQGVIYRPSAYGEPTPITRKLLQDGARHLLLEGPLALDVPVRILHGKADADVPWQLTLQLVACLTSPDLKVSFLDDGDHRLSRPQDLETLNRMLAELLEQYGA